MTRDRLIITCEHGGNRVPPRYAKLFRGAQQALASHLGYDPGALELAKRMAKATDAPLFSSTVTRLLVELNRSLGHRRLFSEFTKPLDRAAKEELLAAYYVPYRQQVTECIAETIRSGRHAVHLSMHSFTPELAGEIRNADVGLLFDPRRPGELAFCRRWQQLLRQLRPDLVVRRNYPYLGTSDGFTTQLRREFSAKEYLGIELEVNQRWPTDPGWRKLQASILAALNETCKQESI